MTIKIIFSLLLITLCLGSSLNLYRDLSTLEAVLKEKDANFIDIHYELYIALQTSTKPLDEDKICNQLQNRDVSNLPVKQQYHYLKSIHLLDGCEDSQIQFQSQNVPDDFLQFYYNLGLGIEKNDFQLCQNLEAFIGSDGAVKVNKSKKSKNSDDTYRYASLLYGVAYECFIKTSDQNLKDLIVKTISKPLQTAIINIQEIYKGYAAIMENNAYVKVQITSNLIEAWFNFLPHLKLHPTAKKEFQNRIFQQAVVNLIKESLKVPFPSSRDRYSVVKLVKNDYVRNISIPVVNRQVQLANKIAQFQVKFINILSDKVDVPLNITANLYKNNQVDYSPIKYNLKLIASDLKLSLVSKKGAERDYQGYFQATSPKNQELGKHQIHILITQGDMTYKFEEDVFIGTAVSVNDLKFTLVQGNSASREEHQVKERQTYPRTQEANEHSKLHVSFSLQFAHTLVPRQVGVYLSHPLYPSASQFLQAQYETLTKKYNVIVDFGNQEHILPHNGVYGAELIVGDERLVESLRWTFAKIEVTFASSANRAPLTDADYLKKELIYHQFQAPREEIPLSFVSFFLVTIVLALLLFIGALQKIGVNTNRIPQDPKKAILVYLFFGLLIGVFVVLTLFWVVYNLIETITILAVLFVPLFLVGNFALLELRDPK